MTRIIIFISVFALQTKTTAQDLSHLYDNSVKSVVTIFTLSNDFTEKEVTTNSALGSGVIISQDGVIMTAAHVVNDVDKLVVKLYDGSFISANVIATNPTIDVAIIKLAKINTGVKSVKLGNPDMVKIGEQIYIIGAPMGLENALSVGYISGKKSTGQVVNGKAIVQLQTDASINTGNSGGPMFNMQGEVIGIVSHILSRSGGFEGIGFVTSAFEAYEVLRQTEALWTGFDGRFLDITLAKVLNMPQKSGFLIQRVVPGSMADSLGMKAGYLPFKYGGETILLGGDIILEISGQKCTAPHDLTLIRNLISSLTVGEKLSMTLWRDGNEMTVETIRN